MQSGLATRSEQSVENRSLSGFSTNLQASTSPTQLFLDSFHRGKIQQADHANVA